MNFDYSDLSTKDDLKKGIGKSNFIIFLAYLAPSLKLLHTVIEWGVRLSISITDPSVLLAMPKQPHANCVESTVTVSLTALVTIQKISFWALVCEVKHS